MLKETKTVDSFMTLAAWNCILQARRWVLRWIDQNKSFTQILSLVRLKKNSNVISTMTFSSHHQTHHSNLQTNANGNLVETNTVNYLWTIALNLRLGRTSILPLKNLHWASNRKNLSRTPMRTLIQMSPLKKNRTSIRIFKTLWKRILRIKSAENKIPRITALFKKKKKKKRRK